MKKTILLFALSVVFILNPGICPGQKITYENGIKIVENGKDGLWGNNPQVKVEYEGKFGNHDDNDPDTYIGKPSDIAFDKGGNIYVLDMLKCQIHKYDKNKKYISSIGRKGQGPGELLFPDAIDVGPDGNIYVHDAMQQKINIYSPDGKPKNTIRISGYSLNFRIISNDRLICRNPLTGYAGINKPLFYIIDFKGKKIKNFGEGPHPKGKATDREGKGGGMNRFSFNIDNNSNSYAAFKFAPQIEKFDKDGNLKMKIITSPVRFMLKNCGIAVDSKERIWMVTMQKEPPKNDDFKRGPLIISNNSIIEQSKKKTPLLKTDMYALDLYSKEGEFLYRFPLTHFVATSSDGMLKMCGNRLYIMEDDREGTFHVYKISDL